MSLGGKGEAYQKVLHINRDLKNEADTGGAGVEVVLGNNLCRSSRQENSGQWRQESRV